MKFINNLVEQARQLEKDAQELSNNHFVGITNIKGEPLQDTPQSAGYLARHNPEEYERMKNEYYNDWAEQEENRAMDEY